MVTSQKTTKEITRQNNNNIVDIAMFNHLVEQVSQIASSLQELKTQVYNPWRPQAPMVQYPIPTIETPQLFTPQVTHDNAISMSNAPVAETSQKNFTEVPMDTVNQNNSSKETLADSNLKALELLAKYHKQDDILSTIIAMLQYFLILKCKLKFHSNWSNKKDFTRAELLLALTTNPTVFGTEDESAIHSTWIRHLKDNQEAYTRVLTIIPVVIFNVKDSDNADVKYCIGKLTNYLLSAKNIIFTKKSIIKETSEKQTTIKTVVKKPNIKYIVKIALDQILIQFLDTALTLQLIDRKDDWDDYLTKQFTMSNYSHVCKYLIDTVNTQLQERAKLAQEKRQKKRLTILEDTSIKKDESTTKNKDGNLGS